MSVSPPITDSEGEINFPRIRHGRLFQFYLRRSTWTKSESLCEKRVALLHPCDCSCHSEFAEFKLYFRLYCFGAVKGWTLPAGLEALWSAPSSCPVSPLHSETSWFTSIGSKNTLYRWSPHTYNGQYCFTVWQMFWPFHTSSYLLHFLDTNIPCVSYGHVSTGH